ncbi:MAG: hypothetical protein N4A40_16050 [Tissierellales bacterium]|jgi:hypothetical protein|nr:hypothetical protein [Tissierellales bacterium]
MIPNPNIDEKEKNIWKELNKLGIYTIEQFEECYIQQEKIDISCFVNKPIREKVAVGDQE